jgi:hypothetical protein
MKDKNVMRRGLSSERHYVLPVSIHDTSPTRERHQIRAPKRPMKIPFLTFANLKAEMSERSQSGEFMTPGSLPNAVSALTKFMAERGFTDHDCVGTQMRAGYTQHVSAHVTALRTEGRAGEYIRNRKSLLKIWRGWCWSWTVWLRLKVARRRRSSMRSAPYSTALGQSNQLRSSSVFRTPP